MHRQAGPQCNSWQSSHSLCQTQLTDATFVLLSGHWPIKREMRAPVRLSANTKGKELFVILSHQSPPNHPLTSESSSPLTAGGALKLWHYSCRQEQTPSQEQGSKASPQHKELISKAVTPVFCSLQHKEFVFHPSIHPRAYWDCRPNRGAQPQRETAGCCALPPSSWQGSATAGLPEEPFCCPEGTYGPQRPWRASPGTSQPCPWHRSPFQPSWRTLVPNLHLSPQLCLAALRCAWPWTPSPGPVLNEESWEVLI